MDLERLEPLTWISSTNAQSLLTVGEDSYNEVGLLKTKPHTSTGIPNAADHKVPSEQSRAYYTISLKLTLDFLFILGNLELNKKHC